MIFSNMEYPGKDYRVQVVDTWLGEEFEPMDNPQNGDKIVYRIIGENGQPVEQKTEVYQNGAWVEQGGGGTGVPVAPVLPMTELSADGWTEQSAEGIYLYTRNLTSENTAFPKYLYVTGTIAEPVIAFPGNEGEIDGEISMGYEGAWINVSGISDPIPLLINKSETSGKMELVIFSESGQITTMPVISLQIDQVLP